MQSRPKQAYIKWLMREEPSQDIRGRLIRNFIDGGIQIEPEFLPYLGNIATSQLGVARHYKRVTLKSAASMMMWLYVGDLFWCRKNKDKYEFVRYVAVENKKNTNKVVGVWDERIHATKQLGVIVYDGNRKGYIVGYNEWEVQVQWEDNGVRSISVPVRDVGSLRFQFEDDSRKYLPIFSNILKRTRKC